MTYRMTISPNTMNGLNSHLVCEDVVHVICITFLQLVISEIISVNKYTIRRGMLL